MIEALRRVERLAGRPVEFFKGDVTCEADLERCFSLYRFWAVIHFAAIKVSMILFINVKYSCHVYRLLVNQQGYLWSIITTM